MRKLLFNLTPFICFTVLISSYSFSQEITEEKIKQLAETGDEKEILIESSTLMNEGYFYLADILVNKLLEFQSENANYNYRKGYIELYSKRNSIEAAKYLEKAIKETDKNFDMFSVKEKSAPVDAYFHLATAYHYNENIDKAIELYQLFKENSKKKSELLPIVDLRIQQCENAKNYISTPVNVYLKNIGNTVNSQYPDYSPVISLDGSAIYFTSRRPWANGETEEFRDPIDNLYPEDIYVSYMDFDSTWTEPKKLEFCNPQRNEATIAVSADERRIYIYEDSTGNGDIYYTDFYHAKFHDIRPLEEIPNLNTDSWETHCMMSHDKKTFYFVSDREGGLGGRDIYMVKWDEASQKWSEPINLGAPINTPFDEDSPFISIDNKTLYYSTNGPQSIGGFDIMRTVMDESGNFSSPENMGYPFNSTNDDIFYTTTLDGRRGYMTSQRADGYGEKDIYEIHNDYLGLKDVAILKGIIKTVDNKPIPEDFAINVKLVCLDCQSQQSIQVFPRLRDGYFITSLEPCKTYRLEYTNLTDDILMGEDSFTTLCDTSFQEIYKEVLLDVDKKILVTPEEEDVVDIPEVNVEEYPNLEFIHYFDYNKNKISTKKGDLKKFVKAVEKQLKDGREKVTINIYSSASHVPTRTYKTNENLAKLRAENMKYDLISYFENKDEFKGRVNVVIVSSEVQGPEYEKDAQNKDKYKPYQYVGLKTE